MCPLLILKCSVISIIDLMRIVNGDWKLTKYWDSRESRLIHSNCDEHLLVIVTIGILILRANCFNWLLIWLPSTSELDPSISSIIINWLVESFEHKLLIVEVELDVNRMVDNVTVDRLINSFNPLLTPSIITGEEEDKLESIEITE